MVVRQKVAWCLAAATTFGFLACRTTVEESSPKEAESDTNLSAAEQQTLEDFKAEIEIGRNMAGRLLAFYGAVPDKQFTNYMNQVGNYVAKSGDYPDRRYMFAILDSDSVNAFACPGGYILVTRGTLTHAKNEAELAAVLGHESAHVGLQHMFKTLKKLSKDDVDKSNKEAAERKNTDEHSLARQRIQSDDSDTGAAIARFMTTASGAGLGILQAAKAGMSLMVEKGLDQQLEFEADREGVKYAVKAGYDPKGLDGFLDRLYQEKMAKDAQKTVMDKTHPPIPDRRKAIADALNKMNSSTIVGAVLQTRFESYQARLLKKKNKDQGT